MFSANSPYSSFFTSGLLSEPLTATADTEFIWPPSPDAPLGPRRGSLPTDARTVSSADESSAFYFTLQPKRDGQEYRSFLSLDLAESQSMRSASLRRKASQRSKRTSHSSALRPEKSAFAIQPTIPEDSQLPSSPISPQSRYSRDSHRVIPSPKPVPSASLPDLPRHAPRKSSVFLNPPRLPSIIALPLLEIPLQSASASSLEIPLRSASAPSLETPLQSASAPSVLVSRTAAPRNVAKVDSRISTLTSSTVSTRVKRVNRSDALACLEGRSARPVLAPIKCSQQINFMNMSDDEHDDDEDGDIDFLDEEDDNYFAAVVKDDYIFPALQSLPILPSMVAPSSDSRSSSGRSRKHAKDWFPLNSFIDLHNDDDSSSWSWRSFTEVAGVSS